MAKSYLILVVSSQWKGKNSKYQGLGIGVPSFGSRSQFVGKTLVKYCKTIANNWQRPYIHWNMLLKVACPSIFQPIIGSFLLWFGSVVKYLSQCFVKETGRRQVSHYQQPYMNKETLGSSFQGGISVSWDWSQNLDQRF